LDALRALSLPLCDVSAHTTFTLTLHVFRGMTKVKQANKRQLKSISFVCPQCLLLFFVEIYIYIESICGDFIQTLICSAFSSSAFFEPNAVL
jgi:hypothetical protein